MTTHNATAHDLIVNHYYAGASHTVYELVTQHGHAVEIDGNKSEGYALALRKDGVGTYAQSTSIRTFPTIKAARAACRNAFSVEPVRGLNYINN